MKLEHPIIPLTGRLMITYIFATIPDPHRCIRHVSLHDGGHGIVPQLLVGECRDGGQTGNTFSEKLGNHGGLLMVA